MYVPAIRSCSASWKRRKTLRSIGKRSAIRRSTEQALHEQRAQHNAELDKINGALNEWRLKAEKSMADADEWRQEIHERE
jgi:hypothetical protein